LAGSVDGLVILGRKVAAERMRRLHETAGRRSHGNRSTADMLRDRHGLSGSVARRQVETATRLGELPATAARLQSGALDVEHAEQAGRAVAQVRDAARRGELTATQADRLVGDLRSTRPSAACG
jgi:hypothetical protein